MPFSRYSRVTSQLRRHIKKAARRECEDETETRYANLNWKYCSSALFEYLLAAAEEMNALAIGGLYKFVASSPPGDPATRQVILAAVRRAQVPNAAVAYPRDEDKPPWIFPSPRELHEGERPCELIFTASNMGTVVVFLCPHSSTNRNPHDDHFVLREYRSAADIAMASSRRNIDGFVRSLLRLHVISCYGSIPRRSDLRFLKGLAENNRKWRRRFESDAEHAREQLRVNWALGVGVVSGLLVAFAQAAAEAFFENKSPLPAFILGALGALFAIRVWIDTRR